MDIKMNDLIGVISVALDVVESELFGATTNHCKRIACLVAAMGRHFGFNDERLITATSCAFFHDNALTEYILSERPSPTKDLNMELHCTMGQNNVESLLFPTSTTDIILYHHEQANGRGPLGKKAGECPLEAELIAISDSLDVKYHLQTLTKEDLPTLHKYITRNIGSIYTKQTAEAMCHILDAKMLSSLNCDVIDKTVQDLIPTWLIGIESLTVKRLAEFLSCIIDYKSEFTRKHTTGIANKFLMMSDFYKFDPVTRAKGYLAASFHDIGKIKTPTAILEKNGKLSDEEFIIIKQHVYHTYEMLKDIANFEEICSWASNHHEKLDGTGYPFGKKAAELDFISRLMSCIDIYQAISEERPYHPARSHDQTMPFLFNMAKKGFIDGQIVKDINVVMASNGEGDEQLGT